MYIKANINQTTVHTIDWTMLTFELKASPNPHKYIFICLMKDERLQQ